MAVDLAVFGHEVRIMLNKLQIKTMLIHLIKFQLECDRKIFTPTNFNPKT